MRTDDRCGVSNRNVLDSFRSQRTKNCSDDESKTLRSLNMFRLKSRTKLYEYHAMVQAVSRRPLTAETRSQSHDSPCDIVVDKVILGKALLPVLRFSPVGIISPLPHTHRPHHRLYLTFKRRIKSHLPFAGIIRSSPYSPSFRDKG